MQLGSYKVFYQYTKKFELSLVGSMKQLLVFFLSDCFTLQKLFQQNKWDEMRRLGVEKTRKCCNDPSERKDSGNEMKRRKAM